MTEPRMPRTAQPATEPVRADIQRAPSVQYRPVIRYYKRMRLGRTYPLKVALSASSPSSVSRAAGVVLVRPVIAGAVVTPTEATLDLGRSDSSAAFRVTPAARGKLRGAQVQFFCHDRLLGDVNLSMKATRQTLTWVLLCLTIALPLLFQPVFGHDSWTHASGEFRAKMIAEANKTGPHILTGRPGRPGAPAPRAQNKLTEEAKQEQNVDERKQQELTTLPGVVENQVFRALPAWMPLVISRNVAVGLQMGYDQVATVATGSSETPFYIALIFLVLTIGSWIVHLAYPGRARGKPVALPA